MPSSQNLTIPEPVLERIKELVTLDKPGAMDAFVADALNSYIHLGQLHRGGVKLLAEDRQGRVVRLRLPFDAASADAKASE